MKQEPDWVCLPCATKRGARIPKGHIPTWNVNFCGICRALVEVTAPRDFGRTRSMLTLTPKQYAKIKARAEHTMKLKDVGDLPLKIEEDVN